MLSIPEHRLSLSIPATGNPTHLTAQHIKRQVHCLLAIIRHGIADPAPIVNGIPGDDFPRPLSKLGHQKTKAAACGLACLLPYPSLILTSPKPRAKQTADHLLEQFTLHFAKTHHHHHHHHQQQQQPCPMVIDEQFMIDNAWVQQHALAKQIQTHQARISNTATHHMPLICLVGHEPTLGELISNLLTGSPHTLNLVVKKASCTLLQTTWQATDPIDTSAKPVQPSLNQSAFNHTTLLHHLPPKVLRKIS